MANHAYTTPLRVTEPRAHFSHTLISRTFTMLNSGMTRYVECERDLECANCFDPAFMDWVVDAEAARQDVLDNIATVTAATISRAADKPLQRIALLTRSLITCDTGAEFTSVYGLLGSHASLFACLDDDTVGHRVQQMLEIHQDRLRELADLSEFAEDPHVSDHMVEALDHSAMTASVLV